MLNIAMQLRLYRPYIVQAGCLRFERPGSTVYAARKRQCLGRQQKAMELLRHLEVAPPPGPIFRLRRQWVMCAKHPLLRDYLAAVEKSRPMGRIELVRRFGATIGMVHSLRHTGSGSLIKPEATCLSEKLTGLIHSRLLLLTAQGKPSSDFRELPGLVRRLWRQGGSTLVGNWSGFPPLRIWDNGLMIMDLSRAQYSEPLLDLVGFTPELIGLESDFFREYFLQGYCATCELPENAKAKLEALHKIQLLQAAATGSGKRQAAKKWRNPWWYRL